MLRRVDTGGLPFLGGKREGKEEEGEGSNWEERTEEAPGGCKVNKLKF